jgi:hypothetical protein
MVPVAAPQRALVFITAEVTNTHRHQRTPRRGSSCTTYKKQLLLNHFGIEAVTSPNPTCALILVPWQLHK